MLSETKIPQTVSMLPYDVLIVCRSRSARRTEALKKPSRWTSRRAYAVLQHVPCVLSLGHWRLCYHGEYNSEVAASLSGGDFSD